MKNGEIYRGLLLSAEDTMNMTLSDVLRTAKNGQISKLPSVYLRGSSIRFVALPELLKNAPVFQKVTSMKRKMEQEIKARTQQQGEDKFVLYNSHAHDSRACKNLSMFLLKLSNYHLFIRSFLNQLHCMLTRRE